MGANVSSGTNYNGTNLNLSSIMTNTPDKQNNSKLSGLVNAFLNQSFQSTSGK